MSSRWPVYRVVGTVFFALAAIAIVVWAFVPGYVIGWDLRVYENAVLSMRAGHDPYLDGTAVQKAFHAEGAHPPGTNTPFTYVYSPITLPLVKLVSLVPLAVSGALYWFVFALATGAAVWIGWQFVEDREKPVFWLVAPAIVFFPGLLQNDVLFSGNIAYILYALVLLTALIAWRGGSWVWFYAAVLVASCFKAPLLSLLAIPVLSARNQWRPMLITSAAGLAIFFVQPLLMPALFKHYLEAVELQFSYNHDFSSSPAGLTADALYDIVPYKITSAVVYALCLVFVGGPLLYLSRLYLAGKIRLKRWVPVMIPGVLLLNPRIMEYDLAPITMMLALVFWRFVARGNTLSRAAYLGLALFITLQAAADRTWRPTACCVLVGLFFAGCWDLYTRDEWQPVESGVLLPE